MTTQKLILTCSLMFFALLLPCLSTFGMDIKAMQDQAKSVAADKQANKMIGASDGSAEK